MDAICSHRGLTFHSAAGSGAFKHTYLVSTPEGTPLALKVYKHAGSDERTAREVEAIRKCAHPGIVRFDVLDRWNAAGEEYVYSLEEFLGGGTLSQRLGKTLLSRSELTRVGRLLVEAVAHIAAHDLVHRDLKPDNIMFREGTDDPVIVDFGLVRDLAQSSLTQTWAPQGPGTPYFSPAEQLLNQKELIDWRSDQFALGVLLTVAATGRHPYQHGDEPARATVERVALRAQCSAEFLGWCEAISAPALPRMVAAWPVHRFTKPAQLLSRWT